MNPNTPAPKPAPLVLHLEATTMSELMDMLDHVMGQLDPARVSAIRHSTDGTELEMDVHGSAADADAAAEETKRRRGRPKKTDAAPAAPATEGTIPLTSTPVADVTKDEQAPATAPASNLNAMQTLTPAEAREKGIGLVQRFFAANPGALSDITALSAKYGVPHFSQISDDKAQHFLADVIALTNGTGAV